MKTPPTRRAKPGLADLSPSNFGAVMATGIVSIAMHLLGWPQLALALLWLNLLLYLALWLLTLLRIVRHPRRVLDDVMDHARSPGFFTIIAGTGVLGSQFMLLRGDHGTALLLWLLAVLLWPLLTYGFVAILTTKRRKPALQQGINGAWLLMVVATQAIAVLGTLLAPQLAPEQRLAMRFLALALWLWGGMLYIWLMTLIFYRYTFFTLDPEHLSPPYWINMGAMAISTLAGSLLMLSADEAPFVASMLPFIKGFTLFYWATATWWIPMLLVLGVWRHGMRRLPLRYDPLYWGAVFPLGMYAVCTYDLIAAMGLDFMDWLPALFGAVAAVAWSMAFGGLLHRLLQQLRR